MNRDRYSWDDDEQPGDHPRPWSSMNEHEFEKEKYKEVIKGDKIKERKEALENAEAAERALRNRGDL